MEIKGLNELNKTLNNMSNNFDEEASEKLDIIAKKLVKKVKLKTPVAMVNGGTLRRSWMPKKTGELERVVYNNVHYAPHVEYGHRTRGGKSFVNGVYMLKKSVKEIEKEFEEELLMLIENLWNK